MATKNSTRRTKFLKELIRNGGNGTKAAIKAGASKKSAACIATRFKKDVDVQEVMKKAKEKVEEKLEITYEKKLKVLWDIATDKSDIDKRASISAIDTINKMDNSYTIRTDLTTNGQSLNAVVILPANERDEL